MATDLDRLDGAVGFLLAHSMDAAAIAVQSAIRELSALRPENERLRAELAACREALRVTEGPPAAQQPRPE